MSRQRTGSLEMRNGVWCVRVTLNDGKRERWTLGTSDKALAKRKAARLVADLAAGKMPESDVDAPASEKVDDYVQAYFDRCKVRELASLPNRKQNYQCG